MVMSVQRCSRCGTARRGDVQVCLQCEQPFADAASVDDSVDIDAALPRPAAPSQTQSHATLLLGVIIGFVVLAVLLKLSIRGVGPFRVELIDSSGIGDRLSVTLEITNTGSRTGRANCRIPLRDTKDVVQSPKNVTTQRIEPDETITEVIVFTVPTGVRPFGDIRC